MQKMIIGERNETIRKKEMHVHLWSSYHDYDEACNALSEQVYKLDDSAQLPVFNSSAVLLQK